ncbi:TonB C-terminal domain-containing protein [Candidatus Sulfurimonas marisnigri]|nr:TonB C-terminal domain-containing protein [Candidatus Sulfurimonas marisnigri]
MVTSSDKVKAFSIKKDNYISVSIDMPKIEQKSSEKIVSEPVIKKSETSKKNEELDIDNLFSNVWTKSLKKPQQKPKIVDIRRLHEIKKPISKAENNSVESLSKKVDKIETNKIEQENLKSSTALEVNEYLAKIQALVYEYFYPPQNSQGNSVEAVIELSSIGRVYDFRILRYSSSTELNSECDKINSRLRSVIFPKNPDNSSGTYTIILRSEE